MCAIDAPAFIYYSYISVFILSLITAVLILLKDKKNRANRHAFIFIVIIALWVLDDFFQWTVRDAALNLTFARFSGFVDLFFLFFLYFSYHFAQIPLSFNKKIIFAVPIFILIPFYFTDYFIGLSDTDPCLFRTGPLIYFCYAVDIFYVVWATVILLKAYRNPIMPYMVRYQVRAILLAIWFLMIASTVYQEIGEYFTVDISPYFIISNLIFVSLIAFATIKCGLFEFDSVPTEWFTVFIWTALFLGFFLFSLSPIFTVIAFVLYCLLLWVFWKM